MNARRSIVLAVALAASLSVPAMRTAPRAGGRRRRRGSIGRSTARSACTIPRSFSADLRSIARSAPAVTA